MTTTESGAQRELNGYRFVRLLGEGGMGVVHLAINREGREVALKVLRPGVVSDEEARERLAREVGSLSRVRSDRIAEVLDADIYGEHPYVVTRFIDGPTLDEHVREHGPLTGDDLHRFAAGLAQAIAAVHKVGVLHRDVKPGNVLLERGPDGLQPVLIDFGLARVADDVKITRTGWLLGTPGYLAPEVLYGDDPTPAADVHAWAATTAYAATGRPPAGRGPAMAVMDRVRRGEFDLNGMPAWLLPLLTRSLRSEPEQRPRVEELLRGMGGEQPTPPAAEPTVVFQPPPRPSAPSAPVASDHTAVLAPDQPRRPVRVHKLRQAAGLLGIGLAAATATALVPYIGVALLAIAVLLIRFGAVTEERHRMRQHLRGHARWYDVPATTLATPGYLVRSLVGTLVLLVWALALAAAVGVLCLIGSVSLRGALPVAGLVLVFALWWGPAAGRVRRTTRRLTAGLARPTQLGPILFVVGLLVAVALVAVEHGQGPSWAPARHAPWTHSWISDVTSLLQ